MGRYLTNTEAYTKLGSTYSGNKGNWFATKEDVISGGGDSDILTSYKSGQFIPDEDIVKGGLQYSQLFRVGDTNPQFDVVLSPPVDVSRDFSMQVDATYIDWAGQFTIMRLANQPGDFGYNEFWIGSNGGNLFFSDAYDNQHILREGIQSFAYITLNKKGNKMEILYKAFQQDPVTTFTFDYPSLGEECPYLYVSSKYERLPSGYYVNIAITQK